jgi:hypothetical protein
MALGYRIRSSGTRPEQDAFVTAAYPESLSFKIRFISFLSSADLGGQWDRRLIQDLIPCGGLREA